MRPRNEDLSNRRYGRLVALERRKVRSGAREISGWLCQCDCGVQKELTTGELRQGLTISCGCLRNERISNLNKTHGMSKAGGAYKSWSSMLGRCRNPNSPGYEGYGGRGISVCDQWSSFEAFYADMGPRPAGYSIERIDVDGDYELSNCKWLPMADQSKNRTNSRYVILNGERIIQAEAARRIGVMPQTLNKWRHEPHRKPAGLQLDLAPS